MVVLLSRRALVSGLLTFPFAGRLYAQEASANPFHLAGAPRQGTAIRGRLPDDMLPDDIMMLMLGDLRIDFAHDGRFIIAFDRDAGPETVLRAETRQDRIIEQRLIVAPGNWQLEHVDAPLLGGAEQRGIPEVARRRA